MLGKPSKKIKKINVTNVTLGGEGGGLAGQNVTLTKVVFKIHFKPFWVILEKKILGEKWGGTPILSHFSPISAILKIFTSVLTFLGGKNFFFAKVPQWWSSFLKKIHCIFRYIRGGRGGGQTGCNKCYIFFFWFFLKASLTENYLYLKDLVYYISVFRNHQV